MAEYSTRKTRQESGKTSSKLLTVQKFKPGIFYYSFFIKNLKTAKN